MSYLGPEWHDCTNCRGLTRWVGNGEPLFDHCESCGLLAYDHFTALQARDSELWRANDKIHVGTNLRLQIVGHGARGILCGVSPDEAIAPGLVSLSEFCGACLFKMFDVNRDGTGSKTKLGDQYADRRDRAPAAAKRISIKQSRRVEASADIMFPYEGHSALLKKYPPPRHGHCKWDGCAKTFSDEWAVWYDYCEEHMIRKETFAGRQFVPFQTPAYHEIVKEKKVKEPAVDREAERIADEARRVRAYESTSNDGEAAEVLGITTQTFRHWRASRRLAAKRK